MLWQWKIMLNLHPGRIAIAYAIVGLAWIFGSGFVVDLIPDAVAVNVIEFVKGTGFVLVTSAALYVLLERRSRALRVARDDLLAADEERTRLATAVEQAGEAVVITDPKGTIVYVNPALERVSGYSRTELVGHNPRVLQSGQHDRAFYADLWATLLRGETWRGTFFNRRKNGTLYEEDASLTPIRDTSGETINYVGVKRDVTRERALERHLAEASRMEAIGQLAGGVAHDFNNLLTAISGYAELLRLQVTGDAEQAANVDEILRASRSAAGLVRQLLAFSRRQMLEPELLRLDRLVEQLAPMLRGLLGPSVTMTTQAPNDLDSVFADAGQIEQILVNLAVNARDAMPDGGRFSLCMVNVEITADGTHPEPMKPGAYVLLEASDTGIGMDTTTVERVFEPFFTTKPVGQGTGLGLATAYGIAKQSGGYLFARSEPGRGAQFSLYLPRAVADSVPARSRPPLEQARGGPETILVVEDEPSVKAIVRLTLERLGYRVLAADDAAAGRELASAAPDSLSLLVTDVRLPAEDGPALAAALTERNPRLKVLFISGYAGDAMVQNGVLGADASFLGKPFTAAELGRRVRALLDDAPGSPDPSLNGAAAGTPAASPNPADPRSPDAPVNSGEPPSPDASIDHAEVSEPDASSGRAAVG